MKYLFLPCALLIVGCASKFEYEPPREYMSDTFFEPSHLRRLARVQCKEPDPSQFDCFKELFKTFNKRLVLKYDKADPNFIIEQCLAYPEDCYIPPFHNLEDAYKLMHDKATHGTGWKHMGAFMGGMGRAMSRPRKKACKGDINQHTDSVELECE